MNLNSFKQFVEIFLESFNDFYGALDKYLFQIIDIDALRKQEITEDLISIIQGDVAALIKGDPAAKHILKLNKHDADFEMQNKYNTEDLKYVLKSYKSLNAVIMYRVSSFIHRYCDIYLANDAAFDPISIDGIQLFLQAQARKLSENTKSSTGVEIHPAARVGERFVIDHGYGTVIGETCEIGNDCYILQGVTLGANGIKDNKTGRRHPKLGNNVEIAGFARVFGPISIGDSTKIFGYAVVDRDIPPNREVSIVNQLQLILPKSYPVSIYGLYPKDDGLEIIGRNLNYCKSVELFDNLGLLIDSIEIEMKQTNDSIFLKLLNFNSIINDVNIRQYIISIDLEEGNILLENSVGWMDFIKFKKDNL